ncbi:molybdenum cofactor synthesis domain-containing protein, partial [uncultured Helicobacter sp.]
PLKIGIFSSGDEVIEPHQKAAPHQIYNTNATSLYTLLTQRGYQCSYEGILADDMNALCGKIEQFTQYDVAITSGGASVGDADLIKTALQAQGARFLFDGINVKPGRHLSCAMLKDTLIILLPGNPLALLLHTHTFVLSVLESLQGGRAIYPKSLTLKLSHDVKLKPNTTNMLLGNIQNDTFLLYNNGKIGSSSLVNMWKNNAIALFESTHTFSQGTAIKVIPYNADFCDIMDYMN